MVAPVTDFSHFSKLMRLDDASGGLFWLARDLENFATKAHGRMWNTRFSGRPALVSLRQDGYLEGFIQGEKTLAHRAVFCLAYGVWPDQPIDHINGVRSDNRPANLRLVSVAENNRNRAVSSNSKSGVMGVFWNVAKQAFDAEITKDGKKIRLGRFLNFDDAVAARRSAERSLGFLPSHGRS